MLFLTQKNNKSNYLRNNIWKYQVNKKDYVNYNCFKDKRNILYYDIDILYEAKF